MMDGVTALWSAPTRTTPLDAEATVPGSKSLTNRALVLSALATSSSTLTAPLDSRDTQLMAAALTALGATVERDGERWTIRPIAQRGDASVDCGLAGTVMRFVPPVAALGTGRVHFDGDPRARERPMFTTIASLRSLGVTVEDGGRNALPFTVVGDHGVDGGELTVDASASSQFVSALLLAAPRFRRGLDLRHVGPALPSVPHIDMTVAELRRRGVSVEVNQERWTVRPGPIAGLDTTIEPDLSNAGAFVAAALVTGGTIRIRHWPLTTDQAGHAWLDLTKQFGGKAHLDEDGAVFTGPDVLRGITADLHDVGELTPVVSAVAALAEGESRLTGVAHLRGHETDRLAALTTELRALGADVDELDDGLVIRPRTLSPGIFHTYDDHRIAHAAAVIGLRVAGLQVENIATTAKTYPGFADDWTELVT